MQTDERKQTQYAPGTTQTEPRPFVEPEPARRDRSSSPPDGLSFAQTIEDDIKGSMQAVGQVCQAVMVGVLLCGLGGIAALLGLLVF